MYNFFVDKSARTGDRFRIDGKDHNHICNVLRMQVGDTFLVSCDGTGNLCRLARIRDDAVEAEIVEEDYRNTELPVRFYLFQGLPKGDKLDSIIQKAVECGVGEITPFESAHCIARIKPEAEPKKTERRRRIALEAAKQCGRGSVPTVHPGISFAEALAAAGSANLRLFCYEGEGTQPLRTVLTAFAAAHPASDSVPRIALMIGSEGGFSPAEAQAARDAGMIPVGLGRRILRTETAAAFVLSCLVYEWEL